MDTKTWPKPPKIDIKSDKDFWIDLCKPFCWESGVDFRMDFCNELCVDCCSPLPNAFGLMPLVLIVLASGSDGPE